jgi:DNA (cytosine-5)-methyltransferase 1
MHPLILSLFPGADLFGVAFEQNGFCVVRGPELLLGQDIRGFCAPPGRFDGVIGGPPCQVFSQAAITGHNERSLDLIPEFARVCREAQPRFLVMENVEAAKKSPHIPREWCPVRLRDWDCGGLTGRRRVFWVWPYDLACAILLPPRRSGRPAFSVLCSSHKAKLGPISKAGRARGHYASLSEAGKLQGFPEFGAELERRSKLKDNDMNRCLGMKLLGNGVPLAMGLWVAGAAKRWWDERR